MADTKVEDHDRIITIESKVDSLREHIDVRFVAEDKAKELAAHALNLKLEHMNEFRGQLKDQCSTFITREEHEILQTRIDNDIRELRESKATLEGKASQSTVNITLAVAIMGLIIAVAGLILSIIRGG